MINYPGGWFDPEQLPQILNLTHIRILDLSGKIFYANYSEYQKLNPLAKNLFKLK